MMSMHLCLQTTVFQRMMCMLSSMHFIDISSVRIDWILETEE